MSTSPIKLALQVSDATLYGLDLTGGQVDTIFSAVSFLEDIMGEGGDLWEEYLNHEGLSKEELVDASKTIPVPGSSGLIFVDYRSGRILSMNVVTLPGCVHPASFLEEDPSEDQTEWPSPDLVENIKNRRITCSVPGWPGRVVLTSWEHGRELSKHPGARFYLDLAPWEMTCFSWSLDGAREFATEVLRLLPRSFSSEEVRGWEEWAGQVFEMAPGEMFFPEEPEE
jgi:hypothetical protein